MMPFSFGEDSFQVGQSATLQCSIQEGDLPLTLRWLFNGAPIPATHPEITTAMFGKRASMLSIDAVSEVHVGNFTCEGKNSAGLASFSSELIVNGLLYLQINLLSRWLFVLVAAMVVVN